MEFMTNIGFQMSIFFHKNVPWFSEIA